MPKKLVQINFFNSKEIKYRILCGCFFLSKCCKSISAKFRGLLVYSILRNVAQTQRYLLFSIWVDSYIAPLASQKSTTIATSVCTGIGISYLVTVSKYNIPMCHRASLSLAILKNIEKFNN